MLSILIIHREPITLFKIAMLEQGYNYQLQNIEELSWVLLCKDH